MLKVATLYHGGCIFQSQSSPSTVGNNTLRVAKEPLKAGNVNESLESVGSRSPKSKAPDVEEVLFTRKILADCQFLQIFAYSKNLSCDWCPLFWGGVQFWRL